MALFSSLLLLSALAAQPLQTDAAQQTTLEHIDAWFQTGRIDVATRHELKVKAVRAPWLLPAELKLSPNRDSGPQPSATAALVEAIQWAQKNPMYGANIKALLRPPQDLAFVIDSETLPLRVSYDDEHQAQMAQHALEAAEYAWPKMVEEYGFLAPIIEAGERYRMHIDATGMGGGAYTAPYAFDEEGEFARCYTYIIVDEGNWDESIDTTVAHEFNHAMQAAMDCMEVTTFWENTATYIMGKVFPADWDQTTQTFFYFQRQPWRSLSYMGSPESDLYEYGGSLLMYFLEQELAPTAGPQLAADLWMRSRQRGFDNNEPDYFDAMDAVATEAGLNGIADLFGRFSESRFFVGSNDDGQHLPGAQSFWQAEVSPMRSYSRYQFPIEAEIGSPDRWPEPFGSNYYLINIRRGGEGPMWVSFNGDDDTRWQAHAVMFGGGVDTESVAIELLDDMEGTTLVEPHGQEWMLMVVSNLGTSRYDPDTSPAKVDGYMFGVKPVAPEPATFEPSTIKQGQSEVQATLKGTLFHPGAKFAVRFDNPNVKVRSIDSVAFDTVQLIIDVEDQALTGDVTVTVINPGGEQNQIEAAFAVLAADPPPTEEPGCGCQNIVSPRSLIPLTMLLMFLRYTARRRTRMAPILHK